MNGKEFTKRIRKLGRRTGVSVTVSRHRGKGSHGTIYYGGKFTVVKHGEIGRGLLASMLKDLGLKKGDIEAPKR